MTTTALARQAPASLGPTLLRISLGLMWLTHGLVLKKGHVIHQGPIKEALKYYHEHVRPALKPGNAEPAPKSPPQPSQQT